MKIDMHCHTREGSPDGKVPIEQYIRMLRNQGFGGMLVTDHDSYGGYRYWKKNIKGDKYQDFLVLKGIEYDTLDAGHILVIMPENIKLRLLELRGIPVQMLIPIVHNYGGILGPAHPCGEKFMSFMNAKAYQRNPDILKEFDFMEIFNACEPQEVNDKAKAVAEKYGLPGTGGSDAHKADCIGLAYTEVPDDITCESDLITHIMKGTKMECGGTIYTEKGTVNLPDPYAVVKRSNATRSFPILTDWKDRFIEAYDIELTHWVRTLAETGAPDGPSAWDGYAACVAADALNRSRGTGKFLPIEMMDKPDLYK